MSENIPIVNRWCCKILPVSEITYIFSNYRKSEIHTKDEKISVYYGREEIESYLDERFDHCLKGLIINYDMVSDMRDGTIRFLNGEEVCLGRGSFIRAKQKFAIYIKNNKKSLANRVVL